MAPLLRMDTGRVLALGGSLDASAAALDPATRLDEAPGAAAHPDVVAAVAEFRHAWVSALRALQADVAALADATRAAATAAAGTESALARAAWGLARGTPAP